MNEIVAYEFFVMGFNAFILIEQTIFTSNFIMQSSQFTNTQFRKIVFTKALLETHFRSKMKQKSLTCSKSQNLYTSDKGAG